MVASHLSSHTAPALDPVGRYHITDANRRRPFASFLPGIAGKQGTPLWVFTVNRGQAIAGFGIEDKNNPIMEFLPANKAYQQTPYVGFRTLLKLERGGRRALYEPFAPGDSAETDLIIGLNTLELKTAHAEHGVSVHVRYFTLTDEPVAALVRTVTLTNTGADPLDLDLLDGLARVQPYGVDDSALKQIGRTLQAWMAVFNLEAGVPFFKLKASTDDSAEVSAISAGHFYLSFDQDGLLPVLVDPDLVFGYDTTLTHPVGFVETSSADLLAQTQITTGKTPCAFTAVARRCAPGESVTISAIIGHAGNLDNLQRAQNQMATFAYVEAQAERAQATAAALTNVIATQTSHPLFDAYCRQTFLDNVIRGGWPERVGQHIYHIYSRKHGDLERDYNAFFLAAEPYSQGNANYRDVNQNRRSDVWFNPDVGDHNIRLFLNLIQLDGYNPLVVRGTVFTVSDTTRRTLLQHATPSEPVAAVLGAPFTPGALLRAIRDHNVVLDMQPDAFLHRVMLAAEQHISAEFGEGFWIDHWTYTLDLIEAYLAIFPEQRDAMIFDDRSYAFFASPATVQPRSRKYVLTEHGVRQYGAVDERAERDDRAHTPAEPWVSTRHGDTYRTSALVKLLCLALNKFATLDAAGMGIEMEAGKPGWYDALNGLPGLLGSSLCETYELLRLLRFLHHTITEKGRFTIRIPAEMHSFLVAVAAHLRNYHLSTHPKRDFYYWDAVAHAREAYRRAVRDGLDGREERMRLEDSAEILARFIDQVESALQRAEAYAVDGVPITYLRYDATAYDPIPGAVHAQERPYVTVRGLQPVPLPLFLEGPVHALKLADRERARAIHQAVMASDLYDRKLGMFKVNASLETEGHEIGRARAFTPGWLENESIWLHMAYKYLLELLRAGLYDEFFAVFKTGLIPFQDPARYGRSPLENSSFIVSSAHPDSALHGTGFVARLSGATAEFLSIYTLMMAGDAPFTFEAGALTLAFRPILPHWLFDAHDRVQFTFLGRSTVTYYNRARRNTFGPDAVRPASITLHTLHTEEGVPVTIHGSTVPAPYAAQVRAGLIQQIEIQLE